MRILLVSLCILIGAFTTATVARAETYYVYPDGSGDFATIQDAVDACELTGNIEIFLGAGTYVLLDEIVVGNTGIEMYSIDGAELCTIDAGGGRTFVCESDIGYNCFFYGITFTNASVVGSRSGNYGGIWWNSCRLIGNQTILESNATNNDFDILLNCYLEDNLSDTELFRYTVGGYGDFDLADCTFVRNHATGSFVFGADSVEVTGSAFFLNSAPVFSSGIARFTSFGWCVLTSNEFGSYGNPVQAWTNICAFDDQVALSTFGDAEGFLYTDPLMCDPYGGDYTYCVNSPCIGPLGVGCTDCLPVAVDVIGFDALKALYR